MDEKEVLAVRLQKIYWIEAGMEQLALWETRIELGGEESAAIQILLSDSERHRLTMEKWLNKANVEVPTKIPIGLPVKKMNFEGMDIPEIFRSIMKYEILMKDSYIELKNTDIDVLEAMFQESDTAKAFVDEMSTLVKEEEQHLKICEDKVGGFKVISCAL